MLNTPFSPWPSYTPEEIKAVSDVLASGKVNYWTGTECREFEKEFALWCGVPHAVTLANGTVALDIALKALNIGPGDEVIVAPRTFIASVSCVVNAGAIPVFADVDRNGGVITPEFIASVLTPRTKAIVCVHLAGWPCDMDGIMKLAEARGIKVIEDCAQAHGARYKGRSVGSIGHIGAWSFCQDKIMTLGGEGGMVTTNNRDLWLKMWSYKDHGKSFKAAGERHHQNGFRWVHEGFGTNWRMTEMQAALGRLQLTRLPEWHARRTQNARKILGCANALSGLRAPSPSDGIKHAYYKCYIYVEPEKLKTDWSRDRILHEINERGVPCYVGSCSEVYLEKAFDGTNWRPPQNLPAAKELGETSLMFLTHPTLKDSEIEKTCDVLAEVMRLAAG